MMTGKRTVGGSQGPMMGISDANSNMQVKSTASGVINQRASIRSHSPGQNNFMQASHQKTVKLQKSQITGNSGVFGTNNLMFGNYGPGQQQTGLLSSNNQHQY